MNEENRLIIKQLNKFGRVPQTQELLKMIEELEHNWNELKKHIETKIKIINEKYLNYEEEWNEDFIADIYSRKIAYENILEKVEELEEGENNERTS